MIALVLTTLAALPLYPLNPTGQDTVNFMNVHFTAGVSAPNGVLATGFEFTAKYEMLVFHPLLARASLDYRLTPMSAIRYPSALVYGPLFSLEALYYRGTRKAMGFIGLGVVLTGFRVRLSSSSADSLWRNHRVSEMRVTMTPGYRFTFGLRFRRVFSVELSITDVRPDFIYRRELGSDSFADIYRPVRFNEFRVSFGYLLPVVKTYGRGRFK